MNLSNKVIAGATVALATTVIGFFGANSYLASKRLEMVPEGIRGKPNFWAWRID